MIDRTIEPARSLAEEHDVGSDDRAAHASGRQRDSPREHRRITVLVVALIGAAIAYMRGSRSKPRDYWAEDYDVRSGPRDDFAP